MEQILGLLLTVFFGFIALYCFDFTFKKYEDDDEEFPDTTSWDIGLFSLIAISLEHLIRWLKSKLPLSIYIFIVKALSLSMGLLLTLLACLSWLVLVSETI
ncbi:hypothetical protein [Planococcus halotolerans]|uniref:Uncharacterized protein n=1 Tax=Planococcus halotolerans TaxID=2233542 RepID=A0A365L798_9BACL|nr:hypothetical protein [Planococcus halotolerans]QHJ69980.1 hypothetical protein DNR44_004915 [Planococcus halotolerans]RAZ81306.1 hypothetical protein DP120_03210 [Planococcus halotolerans]